MPTQLLKIIQQYGASFDSLKGNKVQNGIYESEVSLPPEEQRRIEFLRACKSLDIFISAEESKEQKV